MFDHCECKMYDLIVNLTINNKTNNHKELILTIKIYFDYFLLYKMQYINTFLSSKLT